MRSNNKMIFSKLKRLSVLNKIFVFLGIVAILSMSMADNVLAFYDECELWVYMLYYEEDDYSETIVQREHGGLEKGYIQPGERFAIFSDTNEAAKGFSSTVTVGGKDVIFSGKLGMVGIEELARKTGSDLSLHGSGKVAALFEDFDYEIPGSEAGAITGWPVPFFDIYTFDKRAYFETTGKKTPAGEEQISFVEAYEVIMSDDGHGKGVSDEPYGIEGLQIGIHAHPDRGYRFKKWKLLSGNALIEDETSADTTFKYGNEDVKIKAEFEKAPYNVTVLVDGYGDAGINEASAVMDTKIELTARPYYGYKLKEWQVLSGDVNIENDSFLMPPEDVTIRAVFEADPKPPVYTITFDPDGGSVKPLSALTGEDQKLISIPKPVREDYIFRGWWTAPSGGEQINTETVFESDCTVYARWEKKPVPVERYKPLDTEGKTIYGQTMSIRLFFPKNIISYDGRKHVATGTKLSSADDKSVVADLDIDAEGIPSSVNVDYTYGKTNVAMSYYGIRLSPDKSSVSYNALGIKEKKALDREIKQINRTLKKKKNRVYYAVVPMDLGEFVFDSTKSRKGIKYFIRTDKSGDTLTLKKKTRRYVDPETFEIKRNTSITLEACISGYTFDIPKKEYSRTISDGVCKLTGKKMNLTGETVVIKNDGTTSAGNISEENKNGNYTGNSQVLNGDSEDGTLSGSGTMEDPYLIRNDTEWGYFCDALENPDEYNGFKGKYLKLTNSITVTRMACKYKKYAFCGNFDGDNNTINVYIGSEDSPVTSNYCSPFRYADYNASFKNIKTAGKIYTSGMYVSGLVGALVDRTGNTLRMENCHASVEIHTTADYGGCLIGHIMQPYNSSDIRTDIINCTADSKVYTSACCFGGLIGVVCGRTNIKGCCSRSAINATYEGAGEHAGFIGYTESRFGPSIFIDNCVFDGSFIGKKTSFWSGIATAWIEDSKGYLKVTDTVFDPAEISVNEQGYAVSPTQHSAWTYDLGYYYVYPFGNTTGSRVYDKPQEDFMTRSFKGVNEKSYYAPCKLTGVERTYDIMNTKRLTDIAYKITDYLGNELTGGGDYTVSLVDSDGEKIEDFDTMGEYRLTVTGNNEKNYYGKFERDITIYTRYAQKPVIVSQPQPMSLEYGYGEGNKFSVLLAEDADHIFTYQWYKNTVPALAGSEMIEGATSSELYIEPGMEAGEEAYYYCEITSERIVNGLKTSIFTDIAMLNVRKRGVGIRALNQTVLLNSKLNENVDRAVLTGAADGDELTAIKFTSPSANEVLDRGLIIPSEAVIMRGDKDVTVNYEINYTPGILRVYSEPEPEPEPVSDPDPQTEDVPIHKKIVTGIQDENGNYIVINLYYKKSVSYNGLKHVAKGYCKADKRSIDDHSVSINSAMEGYAVAQLKYKNNKDAVIKNKKPQFTLSYKASKDASKNLKVAVKMVNDHLKDKVFEFEIGRTDLGKVRISECTVKNNKLKKLVVDINGVKVKLSKKDYDVKANSDGTFTVTGKNNFCGTVDIKK